MLNLSGMIPDLFKTMACPKCRRELQATEGELICAACRLAFPVEDEIPIMLIEKARAL